MKNLRYSILAVLAILAWSSYEVAHEYFFDKGGDVSDRRFLQASTPQHGLGMFEQNADTKTQDDDAADQTTLTFHIVMAEKQMKKTGIKAMGEDVMHNIIKTGLLQTYGTGRINFRTETARCMKCGEIKRTHAAVQPNTPPGELCVAVRRNEGAGGCSHEDVKCNFPQCKTMVTNDEYCQTLQYDVRNYFTRDSPNSAYLPLGMRLDSWKTLVDMQHRPNFEIKPASRRKFAFNAIFSTRTNKNRLSLSKFIQKESESKLEIYTSFTKMPRTYDANNIVLTVDQTLDIFLDSVFTLSPAGHNPECYRLYEALESGSIPVLIKEDLYITSTSQHRCIHSLERWYTAPIVVLDSWADLYPTMEKLMKDPIQLDEMQHNVRVWYDGFMKRVVKEFEDYMIASQSSSQDDGSIISVMED